jgi:hypothetical protein
MNFYRKIDVLCSPGTIALTSNDKFFPPLDAMYWKDWTPVYELDGNKYYKSQQANNSHFPQRYLRRNTYGNSCSK